MPLEQDFRDSMTETVQLAARTGSDGYGKPTYGSNVASVARIERRPKMIRDADGTEKVSMARLYCPPATVAENAFGFYRLTMPDGTIPVVLRVDLERDDDGPHHVVVSV
jgi:hypothetical protein